jgi:hypothetical protein
MQRGLKRFVIFGALILALLAGCIVVWFGVRAYKSITVRQPNAYAMQSAGQLIVDHMRLHSGAWPRSWTDLRDTCAATGKQILSTNADSEIEELKKRVEIDWGADPKSLRRSILQGDRGPISVVRLRSGRRDCWVGAEPNQMIREYLKQAPEPNGAANGSQAIRAETIGTSSAAGSRR